VATGYRLARLTPTGVPEPETAVPLTVSSQPAPRLTAGQAVAWLDLTGQPFLFYANAASGRGRLLYHRYDGHYGLVRPAASSCSIATSPANASSTRQSSSARCSTSMTT
jgi:hypothetical protein